MILALGIYRVLLRLYPAAMRTAFGDDMVNMFRDMMAAERAKGRWHLFAFVIRTWIDLPFSAWVSRRHSVEATTRVVPGMVRDLIADLRQAFRSLARTPIFATTAGLTLALGIGAASSTFSVLNAVLLRPLPFNDPDELVFIWHRATNYEDARESLAGQDLADLQKLDDHFAFVAGAWGMSTALSGDGRPQQITLSWVTPDFFPTLGVATALGRWFRHDDVQYGELDLLADPSSSPPLLPVVLSYALYQQRYGADPDVLGTTLQINGQSMIVIGVAPRGFRIYVPEGTDLPQFVDAWTLFPSDPTQNGRGRGTLTTIARLTPNTQLHEARAALQGFARELQSQHTVHADLGTQFDVVGMHENVVGNARLTIWVLIGAVAFVLAIVCANVATLFLVRATSRARELAIRTAVGGGRWRLVRLVLAEHALIVSAGTLVGLVLAHYGVQLLLSMQPDAMPFADSIRIDKRVVLFGVATGILVGLFTATIPAWRVSSTRPVAALGSRTTIGSVRRARARSSLVAIQVALSVVLLVGAGLMLRTLANLQRVDLGFDPGVVTTARVSLPFFSYRNHDDRLLFYNRLVDDIREDAAVENVGAISRIPFADTDAEDWFGAYSVSTANIEAWGTDRARYRAVVPGYFPSMHAQVLAGRTFDRQDNEPGATLTVVIDDTFARRSWQTQSAIGKSLLIETLNPGGTGGGEPQWAQVVGVVQSIRQAQLDVDPRGTIYVPYSVYRWFEMTLVVRTSMSPVDVAGLVRTKVAMLNRDLPVATVAPMTAHIKQALAPTRFTMTVLVGFAVIALALAAVGIYGVVAYVGRLRQAEFGIRLAFGATNRSLARSVLTDGLRPAVIGLVTGIPIALGVSWSLEGLLYGVAPADPTTLVFIALLTILVSGAASVGPVWRAIHLDPAVTLRNE